MLSPTRQLTGGLLSLPALGTSRTGPATALPCWNLIVGTSAVDTAWGRGPGRRLAATAARSSPGGRDAIARHQGYWLVRNVCLAVGSTATGLLRNACVRRWRPSLPPRRRACSA